MQRVSRSVYAASLQGRQGGHQSWRLAHLRPPDDPPARRPCITPDTCKSLSLAGRDSCNQVDKPHHSPSCSDSPGKQVPLHVTSSSSPDFLLSPGRLTWPDLHTWATCTHQDFAPRRRSVQNLVIRNDQGIAIDFFPVIMLVEENVSSRKLIKFVLSIRIFCPQATLGSEFIGSK